MLTPAAIHTLIAQLLPEATINIEDPLNDGVHLKATIISPRFADLSRVDRHRLIYQALGDAFAGPLHALQIITRTPDEL